MLHRLKPFILLAALVIALPDVVRAQGMGISAGANFNELGDIDTGDQSATLENATGWHVHLWFDLPLGPVAFRPGIRYMDAGEIFQPKETTGIEDYVDEHVVTFLEVPVDVRLRLPLPILTPYVMAGPVLRFATDTNNEDRLKSFSLAGGAGVGFELGILGLRLYPEMKYTFGVTSFTKDAYEIGDVLIEPDDDQRLNALMISLGLGF